MKSAELIGMLYDRACRDLIGARELFNLRGDPRSQSDAIRLVVHSQQIIAELNTCLNTETGSLANNLQSLYEYCQHRLTEAASRGDVNPVNEVHGILVDLRNATV